MNATDSADALDELAEHVRKAGYSTAEVLSAAILMASIGPSNAQILEWMRRNIGWRRFFLRCWWSLKFG